LRGTDSSHTLVVIDGIVMNDPSNPNRQFDIGRLSLNNIEKIEILKGSQGLAYGSNAIGGVIVITTKRAKGTEASGEVYGDFGTFNTVNAGGNVQKKIGIVNFSLGLDAMKTEGFSAADIKFNPGAEKDGDKRVTLDTGIGIDLSNSYTLDANVRFVHNNADLDKGGGPGQDDPNDTQTEEELYTKLQLTKNWESGNAETKFSYNRSRHYRNLDIVPDSNDPTSRSTVSKGVINAFALNHTYFIAENLTQNINFDWQKEEDQSKHSNQNTSGFLYHQYELPTSIFNFGIRLDHNQIFNEHLTYKAAAGYKITDGLWKISYSTGFRAPSLNQLFDPT
jgi:vitamin B12 transporter